MDEELYWPVWMVSIVLGSVILLVAVLVPIHRPRRLSDWMMLLGTILMVVGFGAETLLNTLFMPTFESFGGTEGETWGKLVLASVYGFSCGLLLFAGSFLLSRCEGRRRRLLEESVEQLAQR